ncbi:histidine phosphatase superfamily [Amylocarpus encephaloides]|uniref:Histidine phosphatase superfamily n=1 Tax=Amylocarpus encephaloides TaxID=45428 RepID=A0A9P7YIP8_9HELO|nr:histidine phosphatase superfamily [Amylocarpus encephaloides]
MRLLLVRHGETVDNAAGVYAGVTDSALTSHGVLQANRLGMHLAISEVKIAHIFSSDLQRAVNTAEAIRVAQLPRSSSTTQLKILREQDFGFYEGKQFFERPRGNSQSGKDAHMEAQRNNPGFKDVETKPAMAARADTFIEGYLVRLFTGVPHDETVVIVAHGIILTYLWRGVLKRFHPASIHLVPGVHATLRGSLEYLGGWSNTGYLDLDVRPLQTTASRANPVPPQTSNTDTVSPASAIKYRSVMSAHPTQVDDEPAPPNPLSLPTAPSQPSQHLPDMSLVIKAVNCQEHMEGLKKTRGGIGNLKHDSSQQTVDSYFSKKRRTE